MLNETKLAIIFISKELVARKSTLKVSAYYVQVDVHLARSIFRNKLARYANIVGFNNPTNLIIQYVKLWRMYNLRLKTDMPHSWAQSLDKTVTKDNAITLIVKNKWHQTKAELATIVVK